MEASMTPAPRAAGATGAPCVACGASAWAPRFTKGGWDFARCRRCGLTSLLPVPTETELARHHEASYRDGRYATFAAADDARRAVAAQRFALVRAHAPDGPWLDVGCSTGALLACVAAAGIPAEGVEVSPAAVAAARARGLTVHETSIEAFTPRERYAVVTAFDVVEHLPDPARFLASAATWLRPDGVLGLTLPDDASWPARLMGRHWFYYTAPDHVHYFDARTIRRLLDRSGFGDVRTRSITKPLPLGYAGTQLAALVPPLAPVARLLGAIARTRIGAAPLRFPLGEMLVTARPVSQR